jgi:hypothetical protein
MSDNNGADTQADESADDSGSIEVVLEHGGIQVTVEVPVGTDLGHIRTLGAELDEIGAPSSYTLGVNGTGQDDTNVLGNGDIISFRPVSGNKG